MQHVTINFEQVYHKLQDVRDIVENISDHFNVPAAGVGKIIMTGGFHRPNGVDDWQIKIDFGREVSEQEFDHVLTSPAITYGVTYTAD